MSYEFFKTLFPALCEYRALSPLVLSVSSLYPHFGSFSQGHGLISSLLNAWGGLCRSLGSASVQLSLLGSSGLRVLAIFFSLDSLLCLLTSRSPCSVPPSLLWLGSPLMKVRLGNWGVHVVYSHILKDYYVLLFDTQWVENFDFTYLVQFISVVSGRE